MFALHSGGMSESLKAQHQRPEGVLIEQALAGPPKWSRRKLAEVVGLSEGRVRQIINGYRTEAGTVLEIHAPADTLARIAAELDIPSHDLRAAGRHDAADLIDRAPNVGVTEEGDLWITSLEEETRLLEEWIAGDREEGPPVRSLALWSSDQLLEAAVRSYKDQLLLKDYIIQVLKKRGRQDPAAEEGVDVSNDLAPLGSEPQPGEGRGR